MAEEPITHDDEELEDAQIDHEARIADRIIESIMPDELPCDVDPAGVAYSIWLRLTDILFMCGYTADELIDNVRNVQLHEAEPEGSA